MRRRILAIVSPPGDGGIVPQARAIQAHQPDEILLLKTFFQGKKMTKTSPRLMAWMRGSQDLVGTYDELFEVIDLPYTPPFGFQRHSGADSPNVIEFDVPADDLLTTLLELESRYEHEDFRFDILPGSKRVLSPVLIPKSLHNTKITYSLDEGGYLTLHDNGKNTQETGPSLSLLDRFWLTGMPIYVENDGFSIGKSSELYSALLNAQSIEFRTADDEVREATRIKNPSKRKFVDLPLNMRSELAIQQFTQLGGVIDFPSPKKVMYRFKDISWEVQTEEHDFKLGNDNELIAANEIQNHWNDVVEIYQGVSFLVPTMYELNRQVEGLLSRDFKAYQDHPDKIHTAGKFLARCERLGIDIHGEQKNIGLDELVEAEINHLCSLTRADLMKHLWTVRTAEVDILTLGEFGVSMFDTKQAIWDEKEFTSEKGATQIPQNVIIREDEKMWIVNSTSPFEHPNVIHMTRLAEGRNVLTCPHRSQWKPTELNLKLLRSIIEKELKSKEINSFKRKTGVGAKMIRHLFPELLKEHQHHPIFQIKRKRKKSKKKYETFVVDKIQDNESKEKAIEKIGKALADGFKETPGTWLEASSIISRVITLEQKVSIFGKKSFTISMGKKFLNEYVRITGKGNEAIVRPN